jgi:hypothetical protein
VVSIRGGQAGVEIGSPPRVACIYLTDFICTKYPPTAMLTLISFWRSSLKSSTLRRFSLTFVTDAHRSTALTGRRNTSLWTGSLFSLHTARVTRIARNMQSVPCCHSHSVWSCCLDCVYVDSQRADVPHLICCVREFRVVSYGVCMCVYVCSVQNAWAKVLPNVCLVAPV